MSASLFNFVVRQSFFTTFGISSSLERTFVNQVLCMQIECNFFREKDFTNRLLLHDDVSNYVEVSNRVIGSLEF